MENKNIKGLSYLRSISALLIILYHYTTRFWDSYYNENFETSHVGVWWGCYAVYSFFILSGFLISWNYKENDTAKKFLLKRIIRLYPTYWICIAITTIIVLLLSPDRFIGIKNTLVNLSMLQFWLKIPSVDGAYWTLQYEILFYFFIWLVLLIKKMSKIHILCTVWLCLIIIEKIIIRFAGNDGVFHLIDSISNNIFIFEYAHLFISGITISEILKGQANKYICYLNLMICVIIQCFINPLSSSVFFAFVIMLVWVIGRVKFELKYDKPLMVLSNISFPLYLLHQNIGNVIRFNLINNGFDSVLSFIIVLGLAVLIACVIHYLFEKKVGTKLNKILIR